MISIIGLEFNVSVKVLAHPQIKGERYEITPHKRRGPSIRLLI